MMDRRNLIELGAAAALGACARREQPARADYVIRIEPARIELAPGVEVATTTYNGAFPGPLLRLDEGRPVTVDIANRTARPEQLHWHGQKVPVAVDGAAEEGAPYIPAHGARRIRFIPGPAGFRFYHTHVRAGADLDLGLYGGEAGPVWIAPRSEPGRYDREVFLTLKEFGPTLSRGGDMAQDFLRPASEDPALRSAGESAMSASLAKGMPHGYEVGYRWFTVNGRILGHGEPVRVRAGERVLFHVLNASATEIRSLALPGHRFEVVALDGNPVPNPALVDALWIGTAERVDAVVEMNQPGVWVLGDLDEGDRGNGMGIVVEYAGAAGAPQWRAPKAKPAWDYRWFARTGASAPPDHVFDMTFAKANAADDGFNRWTINGVAFDEARMRPVLTLREGARYRLRMRNASDDIHPVHLHRHSFELTNLDGSPTAGVLKDVAMLGGYQTMAVDFVADDPGMTLFHCHQQLHMDFGFMALFAYA
ncbi:MAG TPA: multicopper oxidase domain-containing protein [Caulobacteraceae bacterium]|nr:multicopper oxidase domain-containing protein [Caulobacteraceae bacterium]